MSPPWSGPFAPGPRAVRHLGPFFPERERWSNAIDRSFAGDIVVDSGGGLGGGVSQGLAQRLNRLPQVAAATGVGFGFGQIFGTVEQFSAVDPATAGKIFDVKPLQGAVGTLGRTGIAV